MEKTFGNSFLGIDLDLVMLLHFLDCGAPMNSLLILLLLWFFALAKATYSLLDTYHFQNRKHHLFLFCFFQFWLTLVFVLVIAL